MPRDHRGFLNRVSAMQTIYGLLPQTRQTAIVGAISAATAWFGFQQGGI
jgi:hypothetical protein